jgi:hypothetical protein
MLACYPIRATQENWLHESLVTMIEDVHIQLDADEDIPKTHEQWKLLVPGNLSDERKSNIIDATGIRDRLFIYKDKVEQLNSLDRQAILNALENQNRIANLLENQSAISNLDQYPDVNAAVQELFIFSYGKLTAFKVRERQYQIIFDDLDTKICPFCGIERVMHPEETAQDQDHYLAKSIFPFAAANMRNLAPMCRCCNRDYKKTQDVIQDGNGNRRRAFDPFDCVPPSITLLNSVVNEDASPPIPEWNIGFIPATEEAETWNSVFKIRTRYKRDILNEYFGRWYQAFKTKCKTDRKRGVIVGDLSQDQIREILANYQVDKAESPSVGMANFLEPLVFEFLLNQYDQGNQMITRLVRDAISIEQLEGVA